MGQQVEVGAPAPDGDGDGRRARRSRNRAAALDALLEIFAEGRDPRPDEVAARSGLSQRSVYRYFEDRDALYHAAVERQLEAVFPLYTIHQIGQGDLDQRIDRFVQRRTQLYEAVADTNRAARARVQRSDILRQSVDQTHAALRQQVEQHFAPELDAMGPKLRRSRLTAVDALCQFETLDYYRLHLGLSTGTIRIILVDALHDLLDPSPDRGAEADEL